MMLNCLSCRNINKIIKTLFGILQSSMRQIKIARFAASMMRCRDNSNMIVKSKRNAFSTGIFYPFSLVFKPTYQSSSQKANNQARKILQISDSIIPPLFEKQDYATIFQFLQQISIIFVSSLDSNSKEESKRVLNRIVQIILQVQQKVTSHEEQSFLGTLKQLSENIDRINDTALIIDFDELYLHFLNKFKRHESIDYIKALTKMMENCISAEQPQRGMSAYNEIKKRAVAIDVLFKIEIQINCAILQLMLDQIPEAIDSYNAALELCRESNSKEVQSHQIVILQCLGDLMKEQGNNEAAINYYKLGLAISQTYFEKTNVNPVILRYKIGKSYFLLQRYDQVIQHCKIIEETITQQQDIRDQFEYQNEVLLMTAESYEKTDQIQSSIDYFEKYLNIVEKAIIIDERSYIHSQQKLSQLYAKINKNEQSELCLRKIARYFKIQGDQDRQEEYMQKIEFLK